MNAARPDSRRRGTLLVFAKGPAPGRVKTRLAAEIGADAAARAYRRMARRTASELDGLNDIDIAWIYDPAPGFPDLRWLGRARLQVRLQAKGGLGRRLRRAFDEAFRRGPVPVCAIGTDSPTLGVSRIRQAFSALRSHDVVLGPSEDGGYYLIGMRRFRPELLRWIPWSTDRAFDATRRRACSLGLRIKLLPRAYDVDDVKNWRRWIFSRIGR